MAIPQRPIGPGSVPSNPRSAFSKPGFLRPASAPRFPGANSSRPLPVRPGFSQSTSPRFSRPVSSGSVPAGSLPKPSPYVRPSFSGPNSSQGFSKPSFPARVSPYNKPALSNPIVPKPLYPARLGYKKLMSPKDYRRWVEGKKRGGLTDKWSREYRNLRLSSAEKMALEKEIGGLFKGKSPEQRYLDKKVLGKRGYFAKANKRALTYGPAKARTRRSRKIRAYEEKAVRSLMPAPIMPRAKSRFIRKPTIGRYGKYGR